MNKEERDVFDKLEKAENKMVEEADAIFEEVKEDQKKKTFAQKIKKHLPKKETVVKVGARVMEFALVSAITVVVTCTVLMSKDECVDTDCKEIDVDEAVKTLTDLANIGLETCEEKANETTV